MASETKQHAFMKRNINFSDVVCLIYWYAQNINTRFLTTTPSMDLDRSGTIACPKKMFKKQTPQNNPYKRKRYDW